MFSRFEFDKAVKVTGTEYHSRGFTFWNHFVSILFGQLSGQDSLRGIEAVPRSTFAYANEHSTHELFKKIFGMMLSKCQPFVPKNKFWFKNPLYSLDATVINLCLSLYAWAKFSTTEGTVKLHVKLNHSGYLPNFAIVTTGKVHEQKVAPSVPLEKGDVLVFDKAYNDFNWFQAFDVKGVYFVTRLKKNANYTVKERRTTKGHKYISSDQIIELRGFYSKRKDPGKLRRIRAKDPETGKAVVLLTNNLKWSPETISRIYKERWQIELFFKCIKQQLKVKSFVGTSQNALLSQLWIALIAYLLLSYLKFRSRFGWSLYTLSPILPTNIFARRNLWDWLNCPFSEPSKDPPDSSELLFDIF